MDFYALQAFVKVVQLGSFTRAANALGTQKAHLSRVISQLESGLGVRLLARTTRALSLTEIGREFYQRALAILAAVDDTRHAVQQAQGEPRGTLRLTCGVEFGMMAVSGWLERYLGLYPQVTVDADYTSRLVDIVHEGFDLAIRLGPLPDSSLAARKLGELQYGLYAAPAYLARCGQPDSPQALAGHPQLVFSGGRHQGQWQLHHDDRHVSLTLQPRLRANNVFALSQAAASGLGIAMLPLLVATPAVASGSLQRVLPAWQPDSVPVHALFASARYLTPKVRAFIDLAVADMQTPPTP